ncbi:hypothetical protein [Couchioplanes caeruleus]|uniref:Uncharacterized protein n=2 Tax=Couchioplanes caeruleus TaxID=56438 RepID=A0A1K0FM43_9ACTN|nr:hypothetical protein [Couchioplanes caeruleus]OJF13917.1 hypothetical protein BG844_12505 [Couchioplanes caeruleus subsp. caeruleus]ROP34384.1 hypothetical protein EDD30_7469 [Couchioplanes caeruleus]
MPALAASAPVATAPRGAAPLATAGHQPKPPPLVVAEGLNNPPRGLAFAKDGTLYVASSGLCAPGGVAIRGRDADVTTCGICAGTGTVVKIRL